MEYFEIDNNIKHKKRRNYKNKFNYKKLFCFIIVFFLPFLLFFLISDNLFPKEIKTSKEKSMEKLPDNNSNDSISIPSLEKDYPSNTEFIMNLFTNYNKIDFVNFERNLKITNEKIYSIINHKKENEDAYIILSTIYGAFLADSMGSFCEFKPFNKNNHFEIFKENNRHIFKPGQVTDDSEMAMSQAYAIMDNENINELNENLIYYYYLIWYNSHPLDIGITTRKALSMVKLDKDNNVKNNIFTEEIKKEIKEINSGSLANGLLMRISPILCWFYMVNRDYIRKILDTKNNEKYYELYSKIFVQIEKDSQLTHPNRENTVAGAIFIFMGICAMEQKYSGNEILNMIEILFNGNNFNKIIEEKTLKNHFINIISDIKKDDFTEDIYFGNLSHLMGYYLHSFKLTLYYLYKLDEMKKNLNIKDIYNKIIFSICDFGGDTDTNAAIVGMIIGPLIGIKNFDNKYLDVFLNFYSKKRIIYTNSLMYYFALYLINSTKNENYYNSNFGEKINFNYFKIIYDFIYKKP